MGTAGSKSPRSTSHVSERFHPDSDRKGFVDRLTPLERGRFNNVIFAEKAVWARPLEDKAMIDGLQIVADIFTGFLMEFRRLIAGHSNHWFFVARGYDKEGGFPIFYIAQFGRGETEGDETKATQGICGQIAKTSHRAWSLGGAKGDEGWVQKPSQEKAKDSLALKWAPMKTRHSLDDLETLIKGTPMVKKAYMWDSNNCQHFAGHMFDIA